MNTERGKKVVETNKRKYGEDYYARIALESQKAWDKNGRKPRGFASMSPERRREVARKGRASQPRNTNGQSKEV